MIQDDGTGIYTSFCAVGQGTKRGELRMGTHMMERSLLLCCLVALVIPANSLTCHMCVGNDNDCNPTEVTCPGDNDMCSTTAMYIDSFPCKVRKIFKGCINSTATTKKLSLSPNEMTTISLQQDICDSDLCNTQVVQDPATTLNDLYCYSCISPGASCNSDSMKQLGCLGEQNMCVDMKVMGSFGDIADVNIKGCGQIPSCKKNLVFASQTSSVNVQCCNGNFCNSGTDSVFEDKTPNGIQCYSCNTLDGASCSPEEVVKAQCYGDLTSCLEIAGTSMKDGRPVPSVIKGCATPSMCDSSVLPMLQKLGTATVKCCNGSLCNNQFSESGLKASGYLPIGNVSPGTGIQNSPSSDEIYRPVKSRHPADTKYGTGIKLKSPSNYKNYNVEGIKGAPWNSNSNSGYPKPSLYSYNEFSNTGSIHNPNSVDDCNIFSPVDHTIGNNAIFANSESNTVPGPINYSSEENNLSVIYPGGSALGGEGISGTTTKSNHDVVPKTHPTLPDFTSYVDSNIVPNSNYDNSMDNPNNNDFNSSESVGVTEIVTDWNENQFNSPTETPDISTGYDTTGNSGGDNTAYNPNISLSANNSETSGYSVNIGGFASVPENNGTAQNFISTTINTQSSSIEQNTSGFGTDIYNTGVANNNGSGNYNTSTGSGSNSSLGTAGIFTPSESHNVSHPTNYSLGQNNLTAPPPGGSAYGVEYVSNSTNSNESTVLNAPTAVPDFTSYVDSSIVPNSYYDNSMDSPNNNDPSSYFSAGFTEIVIDWDDNQFNSPTEASDLSTDHDTIGNPWGDDIAYNPDIILSANNNETSTNTMNIGSFGNVPESNGKVQNLTSTTAKTHSSSIEHNVSGYGTDINNMGHASSNDSGNYSPSSENNTAVSGSNSSPGPAENENHNVSNSNNYSLGQNNLTAPPPRGSGLSGEGVSNSTNSNESTIPNAPTAVPDFTSYVDSNIVPNSYYDNSIDNPNNNDFSSYFSAGFTEIVIDWEDNQFNSPTEASDLSTDHDTIGNPGGDDIAYNTDIILSANNNETSGYPMNIGDFANVPESNDKVQNLTSTTAKTHSSSTEHNISGYSTASPPRGSGLSEEGVSNSNNDSNSNDTTVLNAPTAVPDFTSYVDSNIVPNSYYDNSMDNPNNNDFSSYFSAGFTEIVIDWDDNQFNSPTEASDLSTDHDAIGNPWGDDIAYNPDIIISANNNETSANSVNIGGFANVPESNGKVQNLTSTTAKTHSSSIGHNISGYGTASPPRGTGLSGEGVSDTTGNSQNDTIPNAPLPFPDFTSYVDSNIVPNSYYDNSMNKPNTNDSSSYGSAGFIEIVDSVPNELPPFQNFTSYVDSNIVPNSYYDNNMNNPNNNDVSSNMSAGFTDVVVDWYDEQSGSPTVAPDISSGYDSVSNSGGDDTAYNSNIILSANNNETSGYSVNIGSNTNVPENNGSIQNVTLPTTKTHRSDIKHHSSGFATDIYTTSISNNNGFGNYISLSGNNTAGRGNNSSAGTSGSSSFGGYHNIPGSNESSTIYTSSGNATEMSNEWNNNNNSSNHNMEMPIGYSNIPEANHSSPSYDSAGNGTGIPNQWISSNDSSHYMAIPGEYNNIHGNNDSSMSYTGNGAGIPNQWMSSNDSSHYVAIPGEYSNIHGNNDSSMSYTGNGAGIPNQWMSSNDSSHYMAIPGGYNNIHGNNDSSVSYTGNGTVIPDQWISSNDSSHYMAIPGGYNNIHGNNDSSMSYTGDGTGIPNQSLSSNDSSHYMAIPGGYNNIHGNNDSSMSYTGDGTGIPNQSLSSNDSSHYMAIPGGYNNIHGNNDSSMSYTGNGTGISNNWSNSNSSNPNTAVFVGYGNIPGNNASTTHYTTSSSGNGMTNKGSNNSNPNMPVSGGYANMLGNNGSAINYTSSDSGMGMASTWSNSSNPNVSVSGGYANMPGSNVSATYHTSSGSGMGMGNEGNNSSNLDVSVPGGYANIPGSNNYTSYYASSDNGTGMTNEWINNNSSHQNMAPPGGNYGSFNGNDSNYFSNNNYNSNSMLQNNGSTYGNGSNLATGNSSGSIGSYLNNIFSGANDNGSYSHTSPWPNELIPGGSSSNNETSWIYGSNYDPNMLDNNNGSFSIYNDAQSLFSKLNGSIQGNINEWIQNNSFISNLMHTGMNYNGSGPSGYNIHSLYNGSLINYFNSLGSLGKNNITSIFSGGNNGSFNISKLVSEWSNIIHSNFMNPHANNNGSTYGSSYSNIQNPNLLSSAFPNSNGSTNTNGYFGEAGFNGSPSNTHNVSSEGHNQLSPDGNNNYGSNMGHESMNSSSYNSNIIPGVGSGRPSYGGASGDGNSNGHNTNLMGHGLNGSYNIWSNKNITLPDRSTNDSSSGGAGNSTGGANGTFSSASSLWTQSGSFVIFLAIALLVLN